MGTGTTANACKNLEINCLGSEISKEQCEFANKRIVIGNAVYKSEKNGSKGDKEELFL